MPSLSTLAMASKSRSLRKSSPLASRQVAAIIQLENLTVDEISQHESNLSFNLNEAKWKSKGVSRTSRKSIRTVASIIITGGHDAFLRGQPSISPVPAVVKFLAVWLLL
jgi:hypothetical protein